MHFWIPSAQNSAGFWPKDNCCDIYRTDWRRARLDWVEHEEAGTLVWGKADGGCEQGEGNKGREMGMGNRASGDRISKTGTWLDTGDLRLVSRLPSS